MGIGELSKNRRKLASEGMELLHRRNRQPDELLEVFDAAGGPVRQAVGELPSF